MPALAIRRLRPARSGDPAPGRGGVAPGLARAAAALLVSLLATAVPAAAQSVMGTVTEEGTARPLAGVFVQLLDDGGARRAAVLTDGDGRFRVRAPAPGVFRLRAELIGYAPVDTSPITLRPGEPVREAIELPIRAVSLEGIEVEARARCRRRPGAGAATARVWEEARTALEVARWGQTEKVVRFQVVTHRRSLDARTLEVLSHREETSAGYYDGSPYASIPAERLHRAGYVQREDDGGFSYFAPDAAVLLSASFLDDHCFRVVAGRGDEAALVGLAFEPVPGRRLADIEGVLWIDRASAELRRLEFRYRSLPFRHGDWPQVGGRVEFERLAGGMWIVRRWHIRMPLEARQDTRPGGTLSLISMVEEGAEVRDVRTSADAGTTSPRLP